MTKITWKRTSNGNPMLSYWSLKAVVFPMKGGRWNYNVIGFDTGVVWGPKFAGEADARTAAEQAFLEAKAAHDWAGPGKQRFLESLRDGSRDRWLEEQERRDNADVASLAGEDEDYADVLEHGGDK